MNEPEPLLEPNPEQLSERELRLRQRDRSLPWVRIIALVAALVALLVFYQSIGDGVAGCYGKYIPEQSTTPSSNSAPPLAPGEVPLTIEPAKPLHGK